MITQLGTLAHDQRAAITARDWLALDPLYLDTETTGLDSTAEVVDLAVLNPKGVALLSTFIKPHNASVTAAYMIHGIEPAQLEAAPTFDQVLPRLLELLRGAHVCAYSQAFDVRMLQQSARARGIELEPLGAIWHDPMPLYAEFNGQRAGRQRLGKDRPAGYVNQKLAVAAERCGLAVPVSHRATADAETMRLLLHHMAEKAPRPRVEPPPRFAGL